MSTNTSKNTKTKLSSTLDKLTYSGNLRNFENLSEEQQARFKFINGDICNYELVEYIFQQYDIDGAINFAAKGEAVRREKLDREALEKGEESACLMNRPPKKP